MSTDPILSSSNIVLDGLMDFERFSSHVSRLRKSVVGRRFSKGLTDSREKGEHSAKGKIFLYHQSRCRSESQNALLPCM
jgi:hypothetical protein